MQYITTKTIKTSDLIGPALDWAVAKCENVEVEYINDGITKCLLRLSPFTGRYAPYSDWSQGGPIIERERIDVVWQASGDEEWTAYNRNPAMEVSCHGTSFLVAAMRVYVASEMGNTVDIPEELC